VNALAVKAEPLSVPSVRAPAGNRSRRGGMLDKRDRFLRAAEQLEVPIDDLAVQQSFAAIR
jgi:hypothetical protein